MWTSSWFKISCVLALMVLCSALAGIANHYRHERDAAIARVNTLTAQIASVNKGTKGLQSQGRTSQMQCQELLISAFSIYDVSLPPLAPSIAVPPAVPFAPSTSGQENEGGAQKAHKPQEPQMARAKYDDTKFINFLNAL